ncbi:MAG: hypothetical protein L3K06_03285 [Thermoplasmata archaeon]|nr:hypothetical protein [Thermoplasmata archaeon]MCI4354369.1 hypothetical protein [Thermoplasmata archaeon]
MKASRAIVFWVAIIALLLFVEVAEITHLFTLPVQSAVGNLVSFVFALVFTTILALIGAIFIGIYISHRYLAPGGFTPFEEEMLRMRSDVAHLRDDVEALKGSIGPVPMEAKDRRP